MKVYWSKCGPRHGNFGDKITPLLLRDAGVSCEWASPDDAELIGVGSILDRVPEDFTGTIWTTGFMFESSRKTFSRARVSAVRGELTRSRIEAAASETVVGDAGLLCDMFYRPRGKRFKLGIVPHFVDADDPIVEVIARSHPDIAVIDICAKPLDVISAFGECESIVSSSLHGLILADSLGIANRWIEFDRGASAIVGGGHKFRDYYSVYGITDPQCDIIESTDTLDTILERFGEYARPGIDSIKQGLRTALAEIVRSTPPADAKQIEAELETELAEEELNVEWATKLDDALGALTNLVSEHSTIAIAASDQIPTTLPFARVLPFPHRDGIYWGTPADSADAIDETSLLRDSGVEYLVFLWPSFWWLEFYAQFNTFLRMTFALVADNDQLVVFDVRRHVDNNTRSEGRR